MIAFGALIGKATPTQVRWASSTCSSAPGSGHLMFEAWTSRPRHLFMYHIAARNELEYRAQLKKVSLTKSTNGK